VHGLQVILQFAPNTKLTQAMPTDMWPVRPAAKMPMHVLPEVFGAGKGLWTCGARMWLVAVVQFDVTT